MKILLFFLSLIIFLAACSKKIATQNSGKPGIVVVEQEIENPDAPVLTGQLTKIELLNSTEADFAWFKKGYNTYAPDQAAVNYLSGMASHLKIMAFGGTWCGDTQTQLPRFYKIMDAAGIPESNITLYGVDREKKCSAIDTKGYFIDRVPTFIIYYDGVEKGRVIETPSVTLEQDILKILKGLN